MEKKKCTKCLKIKPVDAFNWKNKAESIRLTQCAECVKKYSKQYYGKNKKAMISRVRDRVAELRNKLKEHKAELSCAKCDESDIHCLDFHHLDPNEKDIEVHKAAHRGWSWERILEELTKCVVLCSNCHRKVHAGVLDF